MTTIRIKHTSRFTQIDNEVIRDSKLSWKARGLHHYLLSFPDDWEMNLNFLTGASDKDGRDSVRSGLEELKQHGYIEINQLRNQFGQLAGTEWVVYEFPQGTKPKRGSPESEVPETPPPRAVEPEAGNPISETPVYTNNVYTNTGQTNTVETNNKNAHAHEENFSFSAPEQIFDAEVVEDAIGGDRTAPETVVFCQPKHSGPQQSTREEPNIPPPAAPVENVENVGQLAQAALAPPELQPQDLIALWNELKPPELPIAFITSLPGNFMYTLQQLRSRGVDLAEQVKAACAYLHTNEYWLKKNPISFWRLFQTDRTGLFRLLDFAEKGLHILANPQTIVGPSTSRQIKREANRRRLYAEMGLPLPC